MSDAPLPKETSPDELNLIIREAAKLAHTFVGAAAKTASRPVVAMMAHALAVEALGHVHGCESKDIQTLMSDLYGASRSKVIERIANAAVVGTTAPVVES